MSAIDSLTLFAEIAVALAGFSGVILALRGSRPEDGTLAHARLFRLLEASAACAMFSILPQVLLHSGVSSTALWQFSAACLAVYMLTAQAYLIYRFRPIYSAPPPGTSFLAVTLITGADLAVTAALVFSIVGHLQVVGVYLAALAFNLFVAGLMFVRLILRG